MKRKIDGDVVELSAVQGELPFPVWKLSSDGSTEDVADKENYSDLAEYTSDSLAEFSDSSLDSSAMLQIEADNPELIEEINNTIVNNNKNTENHASAQPARSEKSASVHISTLDAF